MPQRVRVSPFPQLPEEPPGEILFCSPWEVRAEEGADADHWDYMVDLQFQRALRLDPSALRKYAGLSLSARVVVFAEWSTSLSTYVLGRGPELEIPLNSTEPVEVTLELLVRGPDTGGILELHSRMVLLDEPHPQPGGPSFPGSILWEASEKRILESPGARLPMCVVDFQEFPTQFPSSKAAWAVHLVPEALEQPPSLGMQIYLNSAHEELVQLLSQSDESPLSSVAKRMLFLDIGRQLIQRALRDDAFTDPGHGFAPGTLGDALRRRIRLVFKQSSLGEIAALATEEPADFEVRVQGGLIESA